jgi:hypothetical protein
VAKVTGGCLCGGVRYEYSGVIGPASYCHCRDCRHVTGSAFNVGVQFEMHRFKILQGQVKAYSKLADSGNRLTRSFCAECGSPIFTSSPAHPEHIYIKAGSLDDPTLVKPSHQSWTQSSVPWARLDTTLPSYQRDRPR